MRNAVLGLVAVLVVSFAMNPVSRSSAQDDGHSLFGYHAVISIGRGSLSNFAWRADSHALAVAGGNGIWLYDDQLRDLQHFGEEAVGDVAWRPDGTILAADTFGVGITLYDVSKNPPQIVRSLPASDQDTADFVWSPDGKMLATGFEQYNSDGKATDFVKLYDGEKGALLRSLPLPDGETIEDIAWSRDGQHIAASSPYYILTWNVATGKLESQWTIGSELRFPVWSPDDKTIAALADNGSLYQLNLASHAYSGTEIIAPDDTWLGAGWPVSGANGISLVSAKNLISHAEGTTPLVQPQPSLLAQAAFSPDGTKLAGYDNANILMIRDVASNKTLATSAEFAGRLNMAAFSPDGMLIAAG